MSIRLDVFLASNGYFESREKAKSFIMTGNVFIKGQRVDKSGYQLKDNEIDAIEIRGIKLPYVSRGGLKLEKAIKEYKLDLAGRVCMDVGASTGGFTDCMLQNGARRIYAVDVGYGQLDWKLRNDNRVVNMERTNIRNVTKERLFEIPDFASIDVSFISLKIVLPAVVSLLCETCELVYLVKPQFEAGREHIGKNGVVRDSAVHESVLKSVVRLSAELSLNVAGIAFSPVKGPKGNIEFLIYAKKDGQLIENTLFDDNMIESIVKDAHDQL